MRRPSVCSLLAPALLLLLTSCRPWMIDVEGHTVFNPRWAPLLDSGLRDGWQQPDAVLDALEIASGSAVADIGAGSGYFTVRIAERVGADGQVYAVDVQREMIERLRQRVEKESLTQVEVVEAAFDDPRLEPGCCDLVFFSSVYKEIDGRVDYMKRVRRLLRPGGAVAILEFRPDAPGFGPPIEERLAADQVIEELEAAGLALSETHGFLDREYFLVFQDAVAAARSGP